MRSQIFEMKKFHWTKPGKYFSNKSLAQKTRRFFHPQTIYPDAAADKTLKSGVFRVDTHVHTRFSDGSATVQQVENACLSMNIGCCITDHNEIRGSLMLLDQMKVPTIPSIEIGSKEQIELLIFFRHPEEAEDFFRQYIEPIRRNYRFSFLPLSLDYLAEAASEYDTLICLPHPFAPFWKNIEYGKKRREVIFRTLNHLDCIEAYNSTATHKANSKSLALCQILGRIPLAGSDSHAITTIGMAGIDFFNRVTSDNLFDSIKNDQISRIFENETKLRHVSNTCRLVLNHSKNIVMNHDPSYLSKRKFTLHKR
ncbi:MAG: hypothetical protein JRG97_04995 [Deltaproteobacteria bacterium]|nr:hypothetical protein [Deltaproteobacteria bacterium]MBW2140413.1 hypothetical protein [Deltaproteobacteria bacterium]MBW2323714.1 hypothetical protein [Deltaproteobacteria bacterium]